MALPQHAQSPKTVLHFFLYPIELCFDLSLKAKKRWTNISTGLFFLFGGIEYAIIMPTVYLYIQQLGGDPSFLGFVLAAFSLTGLIAAPIFGVLQDKFHNTKILVLVANCFEIIGNFMYFMGINLAMLLGSRLIAGIGAGVGSSLFAQIARTTTEAERAAAISMAMAARQIGLLFGPALNLILEEFHFCIGPFEVNPYSAAGIFMFWLWILLQFFIFLFYFDLPPLSEEEKQKLEEAPNSRPSTPTPSQHRDFNNSGNVLISGRPNGMPNNDNTYISQSLPNTGFSGSYEEGGVVNITPMWGSSNLVEDPRARAFSTNTHSRELVNPTERHADEVKYDRMQSVDLEGDNLYDPPPVVDENGVAGLSPVKEHDYEDDGQNVSSGYGSAGQVRSGEGKAPRTWQEEYLREEIVVLLASTFIFFFNQTVLETALTPMTERLLNFGELENSILYCICGVEVVLGFMVVKYLSKFVSDRSLLLTGFIIELISVVWLLVFYPSATADKPEDNIYWSIIGILGVSSGLAFLSVATISLFSKLTSIESQGHRAYNFTWFSIGLIVQVSGLAAIAVSIISLFSKITSDDTQGHYTYNMTWFSIGTIVQVSGLAAISVAIISLFSKVTEMKTQDHWSFNLACLATSSTILMVGIPFTAVSVISLYSKLTSQETQGLSQGIRRAVGGFGTIMGPLWAGSTVMMGYVMFGVMTFLFSFIIVLMALSWSKLQAPADIAKQKANANLVPSNETDETSPLLINA